MAKTLQEQIEQILASIPYDKIRDQSYEALDKDGLIKGIGEDIWYMVHEQVDVFKLTQLKKVRQQIWDVVFKAIRRTLSHDVASYTQNRFFNEALKDELQNIDIGEAATA